jgi:hypothetical protein
MLAKLTSKNQLTLPKLVVEQVRAEYYNVRTEGQSIILTPAHVGGLDAVQEKLAALGIVEKDVTRAVGWARQSKATNAAKSTKARKAAK